VLAGETARVQRVVQIPDLRALLEAVGHHGRSRRERRVDLLLIAVVCADCRDEGAGTDVVRRQERGATMYR
jgi:hypothetical protein